VWLGLPAGGLALIVSLQPILIGILAPGLAGEQVTLRQWGGLMLGPPVPRSASCRSARSRCRWVGC